MVGVQVSFLQIKDDGYAPTYQRGDILHLSELDEVGPGNRVLVRLKEEPDCAWIFEVLRNTEQLLWAKPIVSKDEQIICSCFPWSEITVTRIRSVQRME